METKQEASARTLMYLKATNYAVEKTPEQRIIRSVKRKTRYHFKLKNQLCMCGRPATEHHHIGKPITYNNFVFIYHNCHVLVHNYEKGGKHGKIIK